MPQEKRTWTYVEIEDRVKEILSDSLCVPKEQIERSTKLVDLIDDGDVCCPCFVRKA